MSATIHHLPHRRNVESPFDKGVKDTIARHRLMLGLIDAATASFALYNELCRQEAERVARLDRLVGDEFPGDAASSDGVGRSSISAPTFPSPGKP